MNSLSAASICQHIGMKSDPSTAVAYSSPSNHCFHCRVSAIPKLEHQGYFCLTTKHVNCPVYCQSERLPFPSNLAHIESHQKNHYRPAWQFLIAAVGIILIGFLFWLGYKALPAKQAPSAELPTLVPATLTLIIPSQEPSKVPTFTAWPTNTPIPATPTAQPTAQPTELSLQNHALEVPIMVGEQSFLMHRVTEGDQILFLTEKYDTNLKVLEWINHVPPAPLFVDKVIVIAPGLKDIDPSLPPLEPYQVADKETDIQGLAGKLGIDLEKLKRYNHCSDTCNFVKGDWLLLPPRTNVSVPYTSTPGPSSTPTTKTHALEVPFKVGKWTFILHRVIDGEQVIFLKEQHQTTIEVLNEINYKTAVPLWAGQVIVIADGLIVNVDPELPPFEPYQVTDKEISIEDLSLKLGSDLNLLKYYNNCSDGYKFVQGDWLLIPHPK